MREHNKTTRSFGFAIALFALLDISPASSAETCKGNPDALGVSRVIAVDPKEHTRIGTMQYQETLPLADHEVVITFDDTIGTHSYSHPFTFRRMTEQQAGREIDAGVEAVQNALGDPKEL